jgi:hypothetical protein
MVVRDRLTLEIVPGRILEQAQLGYYFLRGQLLLVPEHGPQIGQQPDIEARLDLARHRYQRLGRLAGLFWPITAGDIGDGQERLPNIGVAIIDAGRHLWPRLRRLVEDRRRPARQPPTQALADRCMDPPSERLDSFIGCASAHANDDRAGQNRIRQPPKPSQRDSRIR